MQGVIVTPRSGHCKQNMINIASHGASGQRGTVSTWFRLAVDVRSARIAVVVREQVYGNSWHNPDLQRARLVGLPTGALPTFERKCRFTAGNQTQFRAAANAYL